MPLSPGQTLLERFYRQEVEPLLRDIPHAAGRLDEGSEVLGFDDEMSADHDWGVHRLQVLSLNPSTVLKRLAPLEIKPTVETPNSFFQRYLAFDIERDEITAADWLTFSEQKLLTVTAGPVFHDSIGLEKMRARFRYYPRDTWLYQLASLWTRIGQEEHLVGRAGYAGDELGAKLIASRLVRDLMKLCFLMSRTYAPYAKWFGTAFKRLPSAAELTPTLERVLAAEDWQTRDEALADAYRVIVRLHNSLDLAPKIAEEPDFFFTRPFRVIHLHSHVAQALVNSIEDAKVAKLAERGLIGSVDMFSDSVDLVSHCSWRESLKRLYDV